MSTTTPGSIRAGQAYVELGVDPTYKRGLKEAEGEFNRFGQTLEKIKNRFGRRGFLGNLTEVAVGGGAVAAVTMVGNALANATGRAAELANKYREGKIAASEMGAELVKSLPVIGGFAQAVENALDAFTGIKSETAKILADVTAADARMKAIAQRRADIASSRSDVAASSAGELRNLASSAGLPGLVSAMDRVERQRSRSRAVDEAVRRLLPDSPNAAGMSTAERESQLMRQIATMEALLRQGRPARPTDIVPDQVAGGQSMYSGDAADVLKNYNQQLEKYRNAMRDIVGLRERLAAIQRLRGEATLTDLGIGAISRIAGGARSIASRLRGMLPGAIGEPVSPGPVPFLSEDAARQAAIDSGDAAGRIARASSGSLVLISPEVQAEVDAGLEAAAKASESAASVLADIAMREATARGDKDAVRQLSLEAARKRYAELGLPSEMVDALVSREAGLFDLLNRPADPMGVAGSAIGGFGRSGVESIGQSASANIAAVYSEMRGFFQWFRSSGFGAFQ